MGDKRFRYCVLYILDADQHKLTGMIEKYLPKSRGEVFYPCMEYYRRDDKKVRIKAIFPGYVFLYTDMNMKEVHQLIREHRTELMETVVRELALSEQRVSDPEILFDEMAEGGIYDLSDVGEEEEAFIDTLREGNGLLAMSSGYEQVDIGRRGREKKYVVMEGPLRAYADRIIKVDKHNRRAFLEFEINGSRAQAGFNCLPKAHWFPNSNSRLVIFEDKTEVDLGELKDRIMTLK